MLRINLSTRPFYNERAVILGIAGLVVLTAALSAFNAAQILSLNRKNSESAARAIESEAKARELRARAGVSRQSLNRAEVDAVQAAAREANALIDRRAFSWTDLFNRFEETLPAEVRIVAVTPQMDTKGRMLVAVTIVSQRPRAVENLDAFIDRLGETGVFAGVIDRQTETLDDGSLRSVLQGYYAESARPAAVSSPPASDPATQKPANSGAEKPANSGPEKPPQGGAR